MLSQPEPSPIEALLQEMESGGQLDSSSGFSLSPEKAREKFRVFQSALPAYWLLRLIQGCVMKRARSIEITLEHQETVLEATFTEYCLDLNLVKEAWAGRGDDFNLTLASGLSTALLDNPQEFEVAWRTPQKTHIWRPLDNTEEPSSERGAYRLRVHLKYAKAEPRRCASLGKELEERCRFVPCEFRVDGREIPRYLASTKHHSGHHTNIGSLLDHLEPGYGLRVTLEDEESYRKVEDGVWLWREYRKMRRPGKIPSLMYCCPKPEGKTFDCRSFISLPLDGTPCEVQLYRHGILCETFQDSEGLEGSKILIDTSELQSDLSGLKTVRGEAFQTRWLQIKSLKLGSLAAFTEHGAKHVGHWLSEIVPHYFVRGSWIGARAARWFVRKMVDSVLKPENLERIAKQQIEVAKIWAESKAESWALDAN